MQREYLMTYTPSGFSGYDGDGSDRELWLCPNGVRHLFHITSRDYRKKFRFVVSDKKPTDDGEYHIIEYDGYGNHITGGRIPQRVNLTHSVTRSLHRHFGHRRLYVWVYDA